MPLRRKRASTQTLMMDALGEEPHLLPDEAEIAEIVRVTEATWARVISDVLSPPIVWALVAFLIAFSAATTTGDALLWGVVYAMFVCLVPALYIGWMVRRGHITDIHIRVRAQRAKPFVVSLGGALLAWFMLRTIGAAPLVLIFALCSFAQIAAMFAITLWWQISMHALSITGAVVVAAILVGLEIGLLLVPLIFIVSAARVKLNRHTVAQVVAGGILGGMSTLMMFSLAQ